MSNTLTPFDASPSRATVLAVSQTAARAGNTDTAQVLTGTADSCGCCPEDPQPDGARYRALGNAVSVPVAEWIGHRLHARGLQLRGSQRRPSRCGED